MLIKPEIKQSPAFAQAIVRLGLWIFFTVFTSLVLYPTDDPEVVRNLIYFSATFVIYSLLVLVSIFIRPKSEFRPYLTILIDIGSVSYAMVLTEAGPFSPYFLLYPWIYISYAARYGRGPLFAAMIASVVGFLTVVALFDGWLVRPMDTGVYLIFLVVLPFYVNVIIRQLRWATQAAEQANKAKTEFLATMSHEIRTPMSGIIGMANLLQRTKLRTDQKEYVDALLDSSSALHSLIDDVLDLSKIEAGKYKFVNEDFDLADIVQAVAKMFAPTANRKGVELICFVQPEIPQTLRSDANRLRQVLLNLVGNAVKFCQDGEVFINVELSKQTSANRTRVRFEVRDTGPGIKSEYLSRIFEPFYQGEQGSQNITGTGLGTTISRKLVKLMNGEIGVSSSLGKGTCFWFEIPFLNSNLSSDYLSPFKESCRLLVFDPIAGSRSTIKEYLNFLGVQHEMVTDEKDVHDIFEYPSNNGSGYDMVILGDTLNDPKGQRIAEFLRQTTSTLPPLCHLTYIDKLEQPNDEPALFAAQIARPISLRGLRQCIDTVVFRTPEDAGKRYSDHDQALNRPLRFLVAEDSDINAKVLSTFLGEAGHEVTRVTNGQEALELLSHDKFDFVLMDMRMPVLDGLGATKAWRACEPKEQRIPIVALTANATTEDRQQCLDAGMDGFLTKPVNAQRLFSTIAEYISNESAPEL